LANSKEDSAKRTFAKKMTRQKDDSAKTLASQNEDSPKRRLANEMK